MEKNYHVSITDSCSRYLDENGSSIIPFLDKAVNFHAANNQNKFMIFKREGNTKTTITNKNGRHIDIFSSDLPYEKELLFVVIDYGNVFQVNALLLEEI
jgi:hypothetical protein